MKTTAITIHRNILAAIFTLAITLASASAATFTTNAVMAETNTNYDGKDLVLSGPTEAIDGDHGFNFLCSPTARSSPIPTRFTR